MNKNSEQWIHDLVYSDLIRPEDIPDIGLYMDQVTTFMETRLSSQKRYPEDKIDITGIANEPWHYRYVGKDSAKRIYEQGVTLEEYLGYVPIGGSDTAAPAEESGAEETSPAGEETTALAA